MSAMIFRGQNLQAVNMAPGMERVREVGTPLQRFFYEYLPLVISQACQEHGVHLYLEGAGGHKNRQLCGFYLAGLYHHVNGWSEFDSELHGATSSNSSIPKEAADEEEDAQPMEKEQGVPTPVEQMQVPGETKEGKTEGEGM